LGNFVTQLSKKLETLYSPSQLEELAREVGFIQRKSKLTAQMYLDLLLFNVFDNSKISLNDHSMKLFSEHGVQVRKQSIHERFNEQSVAFLRTLLEHQFNNQISQRCKVPVLEKFTSVMIKDSTRFQLPANLKKYYSGSGGSASGAGMHVQWEFDLCSGRVNDLQMTDALYQDTTDALDTIDQIQEGSLLLRDLGYFSTEVVERIKKAKAYYISRLNPQVTVYQLKDGNYVKLDLTKMHSQLTANRVSYQELDVYIGAHRKVPVRLLIELMPPNEVERRLAKARKDARKQGRMLSANYKTTAALNMFVTNVPVEWLPPDQIRTLYRLRWQIEIRFKTWKSFCRIHANKKMNVHRFRTYLYACLLFIFISSEITGNLMSIVWRRRGKLLSVMKCFKAIVAMHEKLKEAMYDSEKLKRYLKILYGLSSKELLIENRKNNLSQSEIFLLNY